MNIITDGMLQAALKAACFLDTPQSRADMRAALEAAIASMVAKFDGTCPDCGRGPLDGEAPEHDPACPHVAPQPAHDHAAAVRLRGICDDLGLVSAIPETNEQLMAAQFAVFGMIRRALGKVLTERTHVYFKTGDADAPEQVKDRNGEVVLAQCKVCGKAEAELQGPCVAPQPAQALPADFITHQSAWRKALEIARDAAQVSPPDIDDRAYWAHELAAFDRAYSELAAQAPQPEQEIDRLTRELDVAMNGESGAARQASLCDLIAQVKLMRQAQVEPFGYVSEHNVIDGPFRWQFSKTLAGVYADSALHIHPVYLGPDAAPQAAPAPVCGNCDEPAPGCSGLFASEGAACKFHGGAA